MSSSPESRNHSARATSGLGNRPLLDASTLFFMGLAVAAGAAVLWLKGAAALGLAATNAAIMIATIAPSILVGMFLGGLAKELSDPAKVAPVLGDRSGWSGLVLATGLGAITPGGPFAAFPIVYALFLAGADVGAVVAYLTAWALIALQRVVVWDLALLGPEFTIARVLASLPLPIIAGALARLIAQGPLTVAPPTRSRQDGGA